MNGLDNHIKAFIEEQKIIGKKYSVEEYYLRKFLEFYNCNYPEQSTLTKEIITEWATQREIESAATFRFRITPVRMFAMYLNRMGIEAYVLPARFIPTGTKYIPYIFRDDEISRLFEVIDNSRGDVQFPLRESALPLLFRMLYCCGLRVSEAQNLLISDVDMVAGILHIRNSKNGKYRDVPMSPDLLNKCFHHLQTISGIQNRPSYLFFTRYNEQLSYDAVYANFRKILRQAGISHRGRGKGPRVHNLRHTFAVHCLRSWVLQKKNMNSYYPVLSTYMGHASFRYTEYYLRLTADMYLDIQMKLESTFSEIIPAVEGGIGS